MKPRRYLLTQANTLRFVTDRWPNHVSPVWRAMKFGEEAGEVLGAVTKRDEGRASLADVAQETAQAVICAMALAESLGFDLWAEMVDEWERCQTRVWTSPDDSSEASCHQIL